MKIFAKVIPYAESKIVAHLIDYGTVGKDQNPTDKYSYAATPNNLPPEDALDKISPGSTATYESEKLKVSSAIMSNSATNSQLFSLRTHGEKRDCWAMGIVTVEMTNL